MRSSIVPQKLGIPSGRSRWTHLNNPDFLKSRISEIKISAEATSALVAEAVTTVCATTDYIDQAAELGVSFSPFSRFPEHKKRIANLLIESFGMWEEESLREPEAFLTLLEAENRETALPITILATAKSNFVGTATLVVQDIKTHPNYSPCLAYLYVLPEHRCRGTGTTLIELISAVAARLGYPEVFLQTTSLEDFYKRRGWTTVESLNSVSSKHVAQKRILATRSNKSEVRKCLQQ